MMRRGNGVLLGSGALIGAFMVATGAAGCGAKETNSGTTGGGEGGTGSTSTSTGTAMGGAGGAGLGGAGGSAGGIGGMGGSGGASACVGVEASIYQVNGDPTAAGGVIGDMTAVHLKGVVAMSYKFFEAKSNAGRCLWGVLVSAPDVVGATTKEYSGVMVVARGADAVLNPDDQKTYCPKLGVPGKPPGDVIPDDVKPGDVLNVIGMTDYFLLNYCANEPNGSTVPQRRVSSACLVDKTGVTVTPPAPHVFTDAADLAALASPTDKAFHDKWGNVKVRVEGQLAVIPQTVNNQPAVVNNFSGLILEGSNLTVGDKFRFAGLIMPMNPCFGPLEFTPPAIGPYIFDALQGFSHLRDCTWSLQTTNKCTDYSPASEDCAAGGPGGVPLMCP